MDKNVYRIGVMVEALNGYGTKILDGFSRFAQQQSQWRIALFDRERSELCQLLATWEGDAILSTLIDKKSHDAAASRNIPIVNVAGLINETDIPSVLSDDYAIGHMAAKQLLNQGFQNFAYIQLTGGENYAKQRGKGFSERLLKAGTEAIHLNLPTKNPDKALLDKIRDLPRPLGVFTSIDRIAAMVIEACWKADLKVPEEVAIIGSGNNKQLCELCHPTLSSVEIDMERRGYEAGLLLEHLLQGKKAPPKPIRVAPAYIAHRRSTDVFAFDDPDLAQALRFIRDNSANSIKVGDVVAATSLSRRSLEGRFNTLVGVTIHDEIWRAHLDRAKRILVPSDLPLQQVAEKTGFRNASALVNYFQLHMKMTPKEFRVANRH